MRRTKPMDAARLEAVRKLYFNSWGRLVADAHETNRYLNAQDADDCVSSLAGKLQYYPPHFKLTEDAFARWAGNVLAATVFMHGLQRQTERSVRRAIRRGLAGCGGLGVAYRTEHELGTEDEIVSDTWLWALDHIDELMVPGTAKLTTRMYEQAEYQVRKWKSARTDYKKAHVVLDDLGLLFCTGEDVQRRKTYAVGSVGDWDYEPDSLDAMHVSPLELDQPLN
jgi:hypothetical protein